MADAVHTPAEEWRAIPGFPDYEASSLGRVRRTTSRTCAKSGYILKQSTAQITGYLAVELSNGGRRKRVNVHRVIALAFHGEPPSVNHQAAHNDGVRTNNLVGNLRWATVKENMADKVEHGTRQNGEKHPSARLDEGKVLLIREKYASGARSLSSLGTEFGVHLGTIWRIVHRHTWGHI